MINLEWLRTFRAVYKTKSLSRAAEILNISQPTVSQQIATLEAYMGQKLFTRKSKGVVETNEGRLLNTLVSGSIESLEEVEHLVSLKNSKLKTIVTIGISSHLYKSMLCHQILKLGEHVHVKFGARQELIAQVEQGRLLYAIIPDEINTFDALCYPLLHQRLVLVATPDIDMSEIEAAYKRNKTKAEQLLSEHRWYAHDTASSYIKMYWLDVFNKKRPAIVPNYVIPNEYEVLFQQSKGSGLSIAVANHVVPFIKEGSLKAYRLKKLEFRKLSLIANKKKAPAETTEKMVALLSGR